MKVLIFMTQFYQLSGAERLGVELAEELNKRKIHTDILSMYTEDMAGVLEAKEGLLQRGISQVHFLGMKVHPSIASIIPAILKLRRLIKEERYDIVETSMVSPTVLAAWATRGTQSRHVAGLHQVFRLDRENSVRHWVWRFSISCNPHIRYYSISDYASKAWVCYSGTPPQYTRTIYNAIPDDCFEAVADRQGVRTELGIPEDNRIALYVGRLAKYKGCDTLVSALGPLLEQSNLHLLFVGAPDPNVHGCSEMIDGMEKQIEDNGWSDRIRFLGYRKDIPRLLASADIIVHPTHMEGFGLVLVEAMAAGLPVVASNAEAIPEVLKNTDSIMVPPDDPEALRKAVLQTINRSPLEAAAAIEKGRKRAEDFRIGKRTNSMVRLFEGVLAKRL
jgi:glycosyltransferase involved in cell wall biosynthesis